VPLVPLEPEGEDELLHAAIATHRRKPIRRIPTA
jgi:hypothetical protein